MTLQIKIENKIINEIDYFYTSDLLLATTLKTMDFSLERYDKLQFPDKREKAIFYFRKTPELEKELQKYFTEDCYNFKKFYNNLKELKNIIHNF